MRRASGPVLMLRAVYSVVFVGLSRQGGRLYSVVFSGLSRQGGRLGGPAGPVKDTMYWPGGLKSAQGQWASAYVEGCV